MGLHAECVFCGTVFAPSSALDAYCGPCEMLVDFAVEREREACAKLADALAEEIASASTPSASAHAAAESIAEDIRARGKS